MTKKETGKTIRPRVLAALQKVGAAGIANSSLVARLEGEDDPKADYMRAVDGALQQLKKAKAGRSAPGGRQAALVRGVACRS